MTRRRPTSPLVLTLIAAQFAVMLDSSILNVALPSIATDLGLTPVGTAWVLNAYFLTFGGLLLISGRASDVFGRRRLFLLGAGVLVLGSLLGGSAMTDAVLICARLIQGAGAAMLSPAAMSVILARFTGPGRARAMSGWGAASTVGGAAGVTLGGILTAALSWQSVLFVTGAVAAVVGVAGWMLLPVEKATTRRSFDAAGATLLTGAAVAVVFGVLSAPHRGLLSIEVVGAAILAVACVVGSVVVERRAADPVLPTGVLRDPRVSGGIAVNLLGGAARIACFVVVALLLQQVLEYGPGLAGLAMLPTSLAGFLISVIVLPRALNRLGPQRVALIGLLLLVLAHLIFATVDNGDSYLLRVLPALVIAAAGVAFSFTPTTLVIAEGIAAQNSGVSSGLASATAQWGGAIGIAVFGAQDAASRAAVVQAGGTSLAAADAGLQAANLTAAAAAGLAAVIALITFPALSTSIGVWKRDRQRARARQEWCVVARGRRVYAEPSFSAMRTAAVDPLDHAAQCAVSHRNTTRPWHRPHGWRTRTDGRSVTTDLIKTTKELLMSTTSTQDTRPLVDSALRDLYEDWSELMATSELNMRLFRSIFDEWHQPTVEPEDVTYKEEAVGGVPGIWALPLGADRTKVLLYMHGGGFAVGSASSHRKLAAHVAKAAGVTAFVLDYRRAPEHPHPAQVEDGVAVFQALVERGIDPSDLTTIGDSAGGNLAIAIALALTERGLPGPGHVVAFSPWLDMENSGKTLITNDDTDSLITVPLLEGMIAGVLGDATDPKAPLANPLYANFANFPRLYVNAGSAESLVDNATRLGALASAAGVDVTLHIADGQQHVYPFLAGRDPQVDAELEQLGEWLRS